MEYTNEGRKGMKLNQESLPFLSHTQSMLLLLALVFSTTQSGVLFPDVQRTLLA